MQYGGRLLYEGGRFNTPDGKGHFTTLTPPELSLPEGQFILSTRRGKQFNSLIHAKKDPLTGAVRDALLLSAEDAAALGVANGDAVEVRSDNGANMRCHVRIDAIQAAQRAGVLAGVQRLIRRRVCDVASGIPDYNAIVEIEPLAVTALAGAGATGD